LIRLLPSSRQEAEDDEDEEAVAVAAGGVGGGAGCNSDVVDIVFDTAAATAIGEGRCVFFIKSASALLLLLVSLTSF
jgi:hypothetical protein